MYTWPCKIYNYSPPILIFSLWECPFLPSSAQPTDQPAPGPPLKWKTQKQFIIICQCRQPTSSNTWDLFSIHCACCCCCWSQESVILVCISDSSHSQIVAMSIDLCSMVKLYIYKSIPPALMVDLDSEGRLALRSSEQELTSWRYAANAVWTLTFK